MNSRRQTLTGRVMSDRMDKTVVVMVETLRSHKLYAKVMRRRKKYKAHDEANTCRIGDLVRLEETRPMSREKRWRVVEVLAQAKGAPREAQSLETEKVQQDDSELHPTESSGQ